MLKTISFAFLLHLAIPGVATGQKGYNQEPQSFSDSIKATLDSVEDLEARIRKTHDMVWALAPDHPTLAIELAREALSSAKDLGDSSVIALGYNHVAVVYDYTSNFQLAEKLYQKAYDIQLRNEGRLATDGFLNNLGGVHFYQGHYEKAMDYYLQSLKIRQEKAVRGDSTSLNRIAQSHNNIALLLKYQRNFEKAITHYNKAITIKEKLGDTTGLITSRMNIAALYVEIDSLGLAQELLTELLSVPKSFRHESDRASVLTNLGMVKVRLKDYQSAIEYLAAAANIYKVTGNQESMASVLLNMANVYAENGKTTAATELSQEALNIGNKIGSPKIQLSALRFLASAFKKSNPVKALEYLEKHSRIKDSMNVAQVAERINRMEVMYETEQKDQQIAELAWKNRLINNEKELVKARSRKKSVLVRQKKRENIALTIGLILTVVLGVLIVRNYRLKKKSVEREKRLIQEQHEKELDNLQSLIQQQAELEVKRRKTQSFNLKSINQQLFDPLTERELEVLGLVAKGYSNKKVSETLFISTNTVKTHLLQVYEKLGVENRTQAAVRAARAGMLESKAV